MSTIGPCHCGGYDHPEGALHAADCTALRGLTPVVGFLGQHGLRGLWRACPDFPLKRVSILGQTDDQWVASGARADLWTPCGIEIYLRVAGRRTAASLHTHEGGLPYDWHLLVAATLSTHRQDGLADRLNLWAATYQERKGHTLNMAHLLLCDELEQVLLEYADHQTTVPLLWRVSRWVRSSQGWEQVSREVI